MSAAPYGVPPAPPSARSRRRRPLKHPRAVQRTLLAVFGVAYLAGVVALGVAVVHLFGQARESSQVQGGVRATSTVTGLRTHDDPHRNGDHEYTTVIVGRLDEPGSPVTMTTVGDRVTGVAVGDTVTVVHRAGAPAASELPGHPFRTDLPAYGLLVLLVGLLAIGGGVGYGAVARSRIGALGAVIGIPLLFGGLIFATANGDGATDHTLAVPILRAR